MHRAVWEKLPFPLECARILILGAGPTGLGAANRLSELGISTWSLYEREPHAGGLAASFTDERGFTWDIGGHVQFSHYSYFDELMDDLLGQDWLHHERESWVWMRERFIPYPFQNNIHRLPKQEMIECLRGLIRASTCNGHQPPASFEDWIRASFGDGIAQHFLLPYNYKVWAWPPREMAFQWVGERVAKVDLERIVENVIESRDDAGWGPNNTFRYPLHGGTGEIWRRLAQRFGIRYGKTAVSLSARERRVGFSDGTTEHYDVLISTLPLDRLLANSDLGELAAAARRLRHSTVHAFGIGLRGSPPPHLTTKCWMYFPEDSSPFYRATVLSRYSPSMVPDPAEFWSLLVEVSESPAKQVDSARLRETVIDGLSASRLIRSDDEIVDIWHHKVEYGYPTPSLDRDGILETVLPALEKWNIFSRGRFGAWKYEVSNQDHSLMQGVELVDRLAGLAEEVTVWDPNYVNSRPKPARAKRRSTWSAS